jgi:hypothetical protein
MSHIRTRSQATFNGPPNVLAAVVAVFVIALTVLGIASAETSHATGKLCGVNACADIPAALAADLSEKMYADTFSLVSKPNPRPYYKLRITADGTAATPWYISKLIVWVPSKHLFRVKEHFSPAQSPYWRTGNSDYENQFAKVAQAGRLKPFPASRRYR